MRILLVRTSAMGDIVHCLPVLVALREQRPEARIAWVVEEVWAPILADHPDLDRRIVVRTKKWRKRPWSRENRRDIRRAVREMRQFAPDVAVDLMGNHKGALLAALSGAPATIGADRDHRRESSSARWLKRTVPTPGVHAVDRAMALVPALVPALGTDRPAPEAAVDFGGERLLRDGSEAVLSDLRARAASGRKLVLIQAGAGWANKRYPVPHWAEVAAALDRVGHDVWLPTAPGEERLAEEIAKGAGGRVRTYDAKAFATLAALMRAADLFLGGDTGPVHLAHALGTPVLCLIGPTDPARNGPYDALDRVLFHELPCSYCYKRFDGPRACILAIDPSQVVERALGSLAGDRGRSSSARPRALDDPSGLGETES